MRVISDIGADLERPDSHVPAAERAERYLQLGEEVLEHWTRSKDMEPTSKTKEGFRLLALHRQGAKGDPSFNACRETARELAYHYNLIAGDSRDVQLDKRAEMMRLIAMHLYLFVSGKMQVDGLGEFCCASKPLRLAEQG